MTNLSPVISTHISPLQRAVSHQTPGVWRMRLTPIIVDLITHFVNQFLFEQRWIISQFYSKAFFKIHNSLVGKQSTTCNTFTEDDTYRHRVHRTTSASVGS